MTARDERFERKLGVINQLCRMERKGMVMTQVQRDFHVLNAFAGGYMCDGLRGWLSNADGILVFHLSGAMARNNLPKSAAIMERVCGLFAPGASLATREKFYDFLHPVITGKESELIQLDKELSATSDDYFAVASRIYEEHADEMPEPNVPKTRIVRGTNPFTGEPFERRVEVDPDDE